MRPSLRKTLTQKLSKAERTVLVGIGSQLRGDDAVGVMVAEDFLARAPVPGLTVFVGSTAPENLTGAIRRENPTHIILVDAVDLKEKAGTAALIPPEQAAGACFCTHQLPLQIIIGYLSKTTGAEILLLGIQAGTLEFGAAIGPEVAKAGKELAETIRSILCSPK